MSIIGTFIDWIKTEFGVIEPALEAWIKKFASDEGKVLLSAALTAAQEVAAGKSIQQAGTDLVATLAAQGQQVALTDALDAIRTQVSYLQTTTAASAPATPAATTPATPAA